MRNAESRCVGSSNTDQIPDPAVVSSRAGIMTSSQAATQAARHCSVSKLLLLIIAIVVVYFVLTSLARKRRQRSAPPPVEPMVPCAHCGINVPRSEALGAAGRFFCSEEHRRLGAG